MENGATSSQACHEMEQVAWPLQARLSSEKAVPLCGSSTVLPQKSPGWREAEYPCHDKLGSSNGLDSTRPLAGQVN